MGTERPVKVLVVDDLKEKLLVYRTVLDDPRIEVVSARSGSEALLQLLEHEFAVVLLDVNMPGMDGFETASLIRSRRRCAHTPIIFVTAHADELHALRGYSYGAVDYILSPIVPEILKTKVMVFVELFSLNRQVREQAAAQIARARIEQDRLSTALDSAADFVAQVDLAGRVIHINRTGLKMLGYGEDASTASRSLPDIQPDWAAHQSELEAIPAALRESIWMGESALLCADGREVPVSQVVISHKNSLGEVDSFSLVARDISERKRAEQTITENERRYRQLVHSMPAAVYVCDSQGRITLFNEAARALWGRAPTIGADQWSGTCRIYRVDGSPLAVEECPMAMTLREQRPVRGVEMLIERPDGSRSHVLPHPEPLFDERGQLVGVIDMLVDISDRKKGERARALLAAIVESTDDAVISETLDGIITSCNPGAERLYGYSAAELIGRSVDILIPADRHDEEAKILDRISRSERLEHFDTVRVAKDGRRIDVSLAVSPIRDSDGRVIGASKIARDVTERRRVEAELEHHREHLEQLVQDRTADLQASHQRLRLADRLASIGTLAAGLGHDMGNLLLPIRMRLDVLEHAPLAPDLKADIAAIASACEYLKRLTQGLRMFALNPEDPGASSEAANLALLWVDIVPFLRNALPRDVELEAGFPADLPDITMSPHVLTQALYNLIKNAGDALQGQRGGRVSVTASIGDNDRLVICVADNGPGMSEEVRRRCLEPFFTTKTRSISTGLGLALVTASLRRVSGTMEIESKLGAGTAFRLFLPLASPSRSPAASAAPHTARVDIGDERIRSYVVSLLSSTGLRVSSSASDGNDAPDLLVANGVQVKTGSVSRYLDSCPAGRAIVLEDPPSVTRDRVVYLGGRPTVTALRNAILAVIGPGSGFRKGGGDE